MKKDLDDTIESIVSGVMTGFKNKKSKGVTWTSRRSRIANSGLSADYPGRAAPAWVDEPEEISEANGGLETYKFMGLPIVVENPVGSERHWGDPNSKEHGVTLMHFDYGYIDGVEGTDGDEVDVYVGTDEDAKFVYVVHQTKKPGFVEYDEDKVMLGFSSEDDAREAYLKHYDDDRFYGGMSSMPVETFREKLTSGDGEKLTNEAKEETADDDGNESGNIFHSVAGRAKDRLLKRKIDITGMRYLGEGSFGEAFALRDGKVLKITEDEDEAVTSNYVKGKTTRHIVKVYDVFKFTDADTLGTADLYGIYEEKLEDLSSSEKVKFDRLIYTLRRLCLSMFGDENAVDNNIWQKGWSGLEEIIVECGRRSGQRVEPYISGLKAFQMDKVVDELKSLGIDFADFHSENIMRRGQDYVIIDLGAQSKAPASGPIQTLEKSIPHIDQLDDASWNDIREAFRSGRVEVTEKIDGSARLEFGVSEGRLFLKMKHGSRVAEGTVHNSCLRECVVMAYSECLAHISEALVDRWSPVLSSVVCELMYGDIPNTLVYGGNGIVVHGFVRSDGGLCEVREYDTYFQHLFGGLREVNGWKIYPKQRVSLSVPEGILHSRRLTETYLLKSVRSMRPSIGVGDIVEGVVVRDTATGTMAKVVDRGMFTALNGFMWEYRELLSRGTSGRPGLQKMVREHVSTVLGCKSFRGSDLAGYVARNYRGRTVTESIQNFCRANHIDERSMGRLNVAQFLVSLNNLYEDWKNSIGNSLVIEGREFTMPEAVVRKTNEAFWHSAVGLVMLEDLVKKRNVVGFIKELMGPGQVSKLTRLVEASMSPPAMKAEPPKRNMPIDRYVDMYEEKLATRLKSWVLGQIGKGSRGIAYETRDGKVLKVTSDATEAAAANIVKGKDTKFICKIFDVFRFPNSDAFGIHQERLEKLGSDEVRELDVAFKSMREFAGGPKFYRDFDELTDDIRRGAGEYPDETGPAAVTPEQVIETLERYNVDMMMSELAAYGILFHDWHPGNVMKRGDKYVLIDMGFSRSKKTDIPVLERVILDTIREALGSTDDVQNPEAAKKILMKYAQILARKKRLNVLNARALGSGTQGTAFDIGGNKVLKVTKDEKEAMASMKVLGKDLKHVSKIFDVFKFKFNDVFGILVEKLVPLQKSEEQTVNRLLIATRLPVYIYHSGYDWDKALEMMFSEMVTNKFGDTTPEGKAKAQELDGYIETLENTYGLRAMFEELRSHGIKFHDFSGANLMKRGDSYVITDLGLSKVDGAVAPPILEKKQPESIGLTIGRFQPFHRGHAEMIRGLAKKYSKVVVLVAGNKKGEDNPFSYDLRVEMMRLSLPDLANKLEVHVAEYDGRPSGFIPGIISNMVEDGSSSISERTAVNIVVGPDRYASVVQQFEKAGGMELPGLDVSLINVDRADEVKGDDDTRLSGTAIRKLLSSGDDEKIGEMFDAHLSSNPEQLKMLISKMRKELGGVEVNEDVTNPSLSDVGKDNIDAVLKSDAERLRAKKGIDVNALKFLGSGEKGVAYQMGGEVLKVTTDASEARSSYRIRNKNMTHVVRISDAWAFKPNDITPTPLFGIKLELLTKLSSQEAGEIRHALQFVRAHEELLDALATKPWDQFELELYKKITEEVKDEIDAAPGTPRYENLLRKVTTRKHQLVISKMKQFDIDKMSAELQNAGVHFADYHEGNLMKRGSQFVINDLGASKSDGGLPPVLEKIVNTVMLEFQPSPNSFGGSQASVRAGSSGWSNSYAITHGEDDDKFKED